MHARLEKETTNQLGLPTGLGNLETQKIWANITTIMDVSDIAE